MNGIVFAAQHNSPPRHPHDATGAFQPGARTFAHLNGLSPPILFDNSNHAKARATIRDTILKAPGLLDVVAYFGHGLHDSLPSAGISMPTIGEFAGAILCKAARAMCVVLYACSAGAPNGFASRLADLLPGTGAIVYGHDRSGHAYMNPYVTRFRGGGYVIAPNDRLFGRWRRALATSDLWARFPFMTDQDLRQNLTGAG